MSTRPVPYLFGKCAAWNPCGIRFEEVKGLGVGLMRAAVKCSSWVSKEVNTLIFFVFLDIKYNPYPTFLGNVLLGIRAGYVLQE